MTTAKDLLASLAGYKTYLCVIAWVAFEVALKRHALTLDADLAGQIRVALLGAAGLALRAAVAKNSPDAPAPPPALPPKP